VDHVPARAGMAVVMAKMQKTVVRSLNPGFEKLCMEHSFKRFFGSSPGPNNLLGD
jgi:hypothetical protein